MKALLEIAAFNKAGAVLAAEAGADRIELCENYEQGGLTPTRAVMTEVISRVTCPVFVMIRPKPGDFIYTPAELRQMKDDIVLAKQCGAGGFVFGILQENGQIDEVACRELIAVASPLPCTFHRAFDALKNKSFSLETLIQCGFQRVLTSGGRGDAAGHLDTIKALATQAAGRIIVMPGGGVRADNLEQLIAATKATEFHSAAITDESGLPDERTISRMKRLLNPVQR